MNNKKFNLLIAGSWEASRLKPYTTYIPKFLISLWKKPAIVYMLNYWLDNFDIDNIILTVNPEFINITKKYLKLFYNENILNKIKVVWIEWYYWSADAVIKTLNKEKIKNNLIVSWSDIFPKDKIKNDELKWNVIFLTKNKWCRYIYNNWKIEQFNNKEWNIIWLYYFDNFNFSINDYSKWDDLIDVIKNKELETIWIEKEFYDFWELDKLLKIKKELDDGAREFNSLEDKWEFYFKKALNEKWFDVISNEINAYEEYYKNWLIDKAFTNIYPSLNKNSFFIKKIEWNVIRDVYDNLNYKEQKELVTKFNDVLKLLHKNKANLDKEEKYKYCYEEYIWKIIKRIELIKNSIFNFWKIKKVNWVDILSFEEIINKLNNWLNWYIENTEFVIIHWDCTFSNSMIDRNWKIYLIDPRWKFWKQGIIWDKNYDTAKFLYSSLTSYDKFNFWEFYISFYNKDEIIYTLPKYDIKIEDYLIKEFLNKDIQIILWVIWLWLAEYIKNDILKMNGAYYEWMRLLSLAFKK